jgi:hypothetical protein
MPAFGAGAWALRRPLALDAFTRRKRST